MLKYILGRPLSWHDFAFYDPQVCSKFLQQLMRETTDLILFFENETKIFTFQLFEAMRACMVEGDADVEYLPTLDLTFETEIPPEAAGKVSRTL